jgi:hypothetical protein
MKVNTESIQHTYVRKLSQKRYDYKISYSTGPVVTWDLNVRSDGDFKGQTGGEIGGNVSAGVALRLQMMNLAEDTIEKLVGIIE